MTPPIGFNGFFYGAVGICAIGLGLKTLRLLRLARGPHRPSAIQTIDAPAGLSFGQAAWFFFTLPARRFHRQASRSWTYGYIFYHLAIFMVVAGYAASSLILGWDMLTGQAIPNFTTGLSGPGNWLPSNVMALIFGNAEVFPSTFLFGSYAPMFRAFAACELPLAVIGNLCLLLTVLRRANGSVRHDLDPAAQNLRLTGAFSGQHLLVRLLIFSIIAMEFAGRFGWIPGIAYYHALFGMTLIALLPFTYLAHIPLASLAVWLAVQRRHRNAVA
jgi:hypothetical protein